MSFLSPLSWLWLAPLAGAILLLWRIRPKRADVPVPSLLLWQKLLQETPASTPHRRLRKHWLLFLQLLTVFLLSLALARPFLYGEAPAGQLYIVILDNSATMRATDIAPSRFAAAQEEAARLAVSVLRPQDSVVVLSTSPRARVLCLPSSDRGHIRDAIARASPTDMAGDMSGALVLARALIGAQHDAHIHIFTDGLSVQRAPLPVIDADLRTTIIGTSQPFNTAITSIDAQSDDSGQTLISVSIACTGQRPPNNQTVSLSINGQIRDAHSVTFKNGADTETFRVSITEPRTIVTAKLDTALDTLAADNTASLVLSPPRKTRILLITRGNIFLERALNALPSTQLDEAAPTQFAAVRSHISEYAVIVLDGDFPAALPAANYLTFNRAGAPTPFTSISQTPTDTVITDQQHSHPVMRFVEMSGVHVRTARRMTLALWAQTLVSTESGALVAAGTQNNHRVVSVAANLLDTDWPLRVSFPLFCASSIAWLSHNSHNGAEEPQYPSGGDADVSLPPGLRSVTVTEPDGSAQIIPAPLSGGIVSLGGTSQVGVYHVHGPGSIDYPVAVNLPSVGSLSPVLLPALNHPQYVSVTSKMRPTHNEWWTWAAVLSLALISAEWWFYHRRVT